MYFEPREIAVTLLRSHLVASITAYAEPPPPPLVLPVTVSL